MLYYKVEVNSVFKMGESSMFNADAIADSININIDEIIQEFNNGIIPFVAASDISGLFVYLRVSFKDRPVSFVDNETIKTMVFRLLKDYADRILIIKSIEEITYGIFMTRATKVGSHKRGETIADQFDLFASGTRWTDTVMNIDNNYDAIKKLIRYEPYEKCLIKELDRIRKTPPQKIFYGHPVHYIIDSESPIIDHLICSLYNNKRIISRICKSIYLSSLSDSGIQGIRNIFESADGGILVITSTEISGSDSNLITVSDSDESSALIPLSKVIEEYKHRVLVIFSVKSKKMAETVANYCEETNFVTLMNETLDSVAAKHNLDKRAKRDLNAKFTGTIKKGGVYTHKELSNIYEKWYTKYIGSKVFPAYAASMIRSEKVIGKSMAELNTMIGLDTVKTVIKEIISYSSMQKVYKDKGIQMESPCRHMIFYGNPGTAKTTIARLFANIMKEKGLLSSNKVIEVGRSDLIEKYVGWTAKNVKAKIMNAKGGILFIDEAYSLVDGGNSFGDEAINTLVQEMENVREDTIIILAGYPDKMEQFIQSNPGIRSRIGFHVKFDNYSEDELIQLLKLMTSNKNLKIDEAAITKARREIKKAIKTPDFGNGRFIRNLLERSIMRQSVRLSEDDKYMDMNNDQIITISESDIVTMDKAQSRAKVGFTA